MNRFHVQLDNWLDGGDSDSGGGNDDDGNEDDGYDKVNGAARTTALKFAATGTSLGTGSTRYSSFKLGFRNCSFMG